MKFTVKGKKEVAVKDIALGELFEYNGSIYMLAMDENGTRAVDISQGQIITPFLNTKVKPMVAKEIIIEER